MPAIAKSDHSQPPPRCTKEVCEAYRLEKGIVFLKHGSFGAIPEPIRLAVDSWRARIEARPIEMIARKMKQHLGEVKHVLGEYIGTEPHRIGLITNATTGVGAVLRSIAWKRGDRIVITNQGYNAVRQAIQYCCERFGCEAVILDLPLPLEDHQIILDRFMKAIDTHTRLVIVDHITSPTAIILPVAEIARACRDKGVLCLVDGAHAPGMIPLNIDEIGADWYTGNLHKWVCAPKGCAFLVASAQTETWTHPETTSHMHGHGFAEEFDWQGTRDFAPWLTIPAAIEFVSGGFPGGIREHNHQLATWAQKKLCQDFGTRSISPIDGSMIGSMATIPLPPAIAQRFVSAADFQATLYDTHKIEVPIIDWGGAWHARVSAQAYNCPEDYFALSAAVCSEALVR